MSIFIQKIDPTFIKSDFKKSFLWSWKPYTDQKQNPVNLIL